MPTISDCDNPKATRLDKQEGHRPNNLDRAELAKIALLAFDEASNDGEPEEPAGEVVSDLLCDLMHFCRMNNLDWELLVHRAADNHESEREGE